jgi:hypothetical protein
MGTEIRVKVSDELDQILFIVSEEMGTKKTEYIKSLIIKDLRERGVHSRIPEKKGLDKIIPNKSLIST